MQEKTIFVAEDGTRFDNKEDCLDWDEISERIKILEKVDKYVPMNGLYLKAVKIKKSGFILFAEIVVMIISWGDT